MKNARSCRTRHDRDALSNAASIIVLASATDRKNSATTAAHVHLGKGKELPYDRGVLRRPTALLCGLARVHGILHEPMGAQSPPIEVLLSLGVLAGC